MSLLKDKLNVIAYFTERTRKEKLPFSIQYRYPDSELTPNKRLN